MSVPDPHLTRREALVLGAATGVAADWVLFGHTHRAGPLDGDDTAEGEVPGGPRLVNTGCWVYERVFLGDSGRSSPYWPGTVVEVGETGPPRLSNVLEELPG